MKIKNEDKGNKGEWFLMKSEKKYSIGEFSSKTNTPIRTLHYYDEIGLLKPAKNPSSGHRQYTDRDVLTLQKIVSFKFIGYSLDQIQALLNEASFDSSLAQTLEVQKLAFQQKKEQIETSLRTIQRTQKILQEQGEVDSTILMSLISNIQTEKQQREWLEQRFSKDTVDQLYDRPEEELINLDQDFIYFSQQLKKFCAEGRPIDDPQVQEFIRGYMEMAIRFLGKDNILSFAQIGEAEANELDSIVPNPFTSEEDEWLGLAMGYFMEHVEGGEWEWMKSLLGINETTEK